MKKMISLLLLCVCLINVLLLSACDETSNDNNSNSNCTHEWEWYSGTVTCSNNGYIIYKCNFCNETKKEYESAYGCYDMDEDDYCDECYFYLGENNYVPDDYGCVHSYSDATCTQPPKCIKCGETCGVALGHNYSSATCKKPATCSRCSETKGTTSEHSYSDATCTQPAKCIVCGKTNGTASAHQYNNNWDYGHCSKCGAERANYYLEYSYGSTFTYKGAVSTFEITIGSSASIITAHKYLIQEGYCSSGYAVKVPITIKNVGTETGYLSDGLDYSLYSGDGTEVPWQFTITYDDCYDSDSLRPNGSITKYFYFNYTVDGEYVIEFDDNENNQITLVLKVRK